MNLYNDNYLELPKGYEWSKPTDDKVQKLSNMLQALDQIDAVATGRENIKMKNRMIVQRGIPSHRPSVVQPKSQHSSDLYITESINSTAAQALLTNNSTTQPNNHVAPLTPSAADSLSTSTSPTSSSSSSSLNISPDPRNVLSPSVSPELQETANTLSAHSIAYIKLKGSPCFFYLCPNFYGTWNIGNFATAEKSQDGSQWRIKPLKGYENNNIEISDDGKNYRTLTNTRNIVQPVTSTSNTVATTPAITPSVASPISARSAEIALNEIRVENGTIIFPATGNESIGYSTENARSVYPAKLDRNVLRTTNHLYTAEKRNNQWTLTPKVKYPITFTITSGNRTEQIRLNSNGSSTASQVHNTASPTVAPNATSLASASVSSSTENSSAGFISRSVDSSPAATITGASATVKPSASLMTSSPNSSTSAIEDPKYEDIDRYIDTFRQAEAQYREMLKTFSNASSSVDYSVFCHRAINLHDEVIVTIGDEQDLNIRKKWLTTKGKDTFVNQELQKSVNSFVEHMKGLGMQNENKTSSALELINFKKVYQSVRQSTNNDATLTLLDQAAELSDLPNEINKCKEYFLSKNTYTPSINESRQVASAASALLQLNNQMTTSQITEKLIEAARMVKTKPAFTPKQFVQLLQIQKSCEEIRSNSSLSDLQKNGKYQELFNSNYNLFEDISESNNSLFSSVGERTGRSISLAMRDTLAPEAIDWLISAALTPGGLSGVPEGMYFSVSSNEKDPQPLVAANRISVRKIPPSPNTRPNTTEETPEKKPRKIDEITSKDQLDKCLEQYHKVAVVVSMDDCPHCTTLKDALASKLNSFDEKTNILVVNSTANNELAKNILLADDNGYRPKTVLYADGKRTSVVFEGSGTYNQIISALQKDNPTTASR